MQDDGQRGGQAHVNTLSITRNCEMNVRAARRFSNVRRLFVLCLLEPTTEDGDYVVLSTDAAMCLVPFVSTFPKLEYLFAGCRTYDEEYECEDLTTYDDFCIGPDNHIELMQGLITSFCGAFKTGSLPDCLGTLEGIASCVDICRPCFESGAASGTSPGCSFCTNICSYLPLAEVFHRGYDYDSFCFSWGHLLKLILQRPGGLTYAKKKLTRLLEDFLVNLFCIGADSVKLTDEEILGLRQRFKEYQGQQFVLFLSDACFTGAKEALPYLCKTLQIRKEVVKQKVNDCFRDHSKTCCFPSLLWTDFEIGLPVDRGEISIVLDDSTDPALSRVRETGAVEGLIEGH